MNEPNSNKWRSHGCLARTCIGVLVSYCKYILFSFHGASWLIGSAGSHSIHVSRCFCCFITTEIAGILQKDPRVGVQQSEPDYPLPKLIQYGSRSHLFFKYSRKKWNMGSLRIFISRIPMNNNQSLSSTRFSPPQLFIHQAAVACPLLSSLGISRPGYCVFRACCVHAKHASSVSHVVSQSVFGFCLFVSHSGVTPQGGLRRPHGEDSGHDHGRSLQAIAPATDVAIGMLGQRRPTLPLQSPQVKYEHTPSTLSVLSTVNYEH